LCAYGPVLLGHGDPAIAQAIRAAAQRGAVLGATHAEEVRLAERIAAFMPSMERMRFVSTGTEACMSALRVARAFTGRSRFIRFAGDYHGHSDEMIFSAGASSNSAAGLAAGITREASANAIVLPYDDVDAVSETFELFGVEIAAVIVEPVCANMGLVVPQPGYLERLRAETARAGALLIFDEVITGFRLGLGGAQERFGVRPDLTCIGKALGGGLPIAAFGGRADVMATLAPEGRVFQGGTFSGNPVCVAAAHALIDRLEGDPDVYRRMDATAAQLAAGIERCLAQAGLPYPVVRIASIVDFMFRASPAHRTFDEACTADAEAYAAYYWAMLEHGVHLAPSQMEVMFVTAAHGDDDVAQTLAAIESSLTP
ncbi:MAG TPA: glutamate-1-semialdehyde 2,1-aminomutase, partial [Candidatus Eremiobacteraceae bacterium]|nr:glutamate-1-semialdehyde 2,1-aminomutase [Candidatus Eremiobacteraceae bacterium]